MYTFKQEQYVIVQGANLEWKNIENKQLLKNKAMQYETNFLRIPCQKICMYNILKM